MRKEQHVSNQTQHITMFTVIRNRPDVLAGLVQSGRPSDRGLVSKPWATWCFGCGSVSTNCRAPLPYTIITTRPDDASRGLCTGRASEYNDGLGTSHVHRLQILDTSSPDLIGASQVAQDVNHRHESSRVASHDERQHVPGQPRISGLKYVAMMPRRI